MWSYLYNLPSTMAKYMKPNTEGTVGETFGGAKGPAEQIRSDREGLKRQVEHLYEVQTQGKELARCASKLHSVSAERDRLKVALREERREKDRVQADFDQAMVKLQAMREERKGLQGALFKASAGNEQMKQVAQQQLAELRGQLSTAQQMVKEGEQQVRILREEIRNKDIMLETRGAELQGAQAYLSTVDRLSHAEALDQAQHLNAQILQLAAQIADSLPLEGPVAPSAQPKEHRKSVQRSIGTTMVRALLRMRRTPDRTLVQVAIQASLCDFVTWISTAWNVQLTARQNKLLSDIHGEIFQRGKSQ